MEAGDRLRAQVRSNTQKSVLLVAGFPFVLPLVSFFFVFFILAAFSQRDALARAGDVFVAVLILVGLATIIWLPIGYLISQWMIDKATGARLLSRSEEPRLWALFENLCRICGMRMPALRIIETDALNAFASGMREGQYSVTVTRGLINALSDAELEGVLAHEIAHIRNRDVRLLVVATILVGLVPILHDVVMKVFWLIVMGCLNFYRAVFALIRVPLAAALATVSYTALFWAAKGVAYLIGMAGHICSLIIHYSLSRKREFMADAGAVEITGNPDALISALRRVSCDNVIETSIAGVREMLFDSPRFAGLTDLFATHPPIEKRIEAISHYAEEQRRGADRPGKGALRATAEPTVVDEPPAADREVIDGYCRAFLRAMDGRPETVDGEQRLAIYRRARRALGKRLDEFEPPLAAAEVRRLLDGLEVAIGSTESRASEPVARPRRQA